MTTQPTNEQTTPITVTPSNQWRRSSTEGDLYELPGCGNIARLRRPGLTGMLSRAGRVANPITRAVLKFLAVTNDPLARPSEQQLIESYKDHTQALVDIAALCFVEPRFYRNKQQCQSCGHSWDHATEEPRPCPQCQGFEIRSAALEEGEIGPEDLTDVDYHWIVGTLVEGRAAKLAEFRVS